MRDRPVWGILIDGPIRRKWLVGIGKDKYQMATLLSRIFGKKAQQAESAASPELDVSALRPLVESQRVVSTDPKDLSGDWPMHQVTTVFPSAQRALFQKYHIGGCSSCGFQPTDTLANVAMNHGVNVGEVIDHIHMSQAMEKNLEITVSETAELLKQGTIKLLDVRTPGEYATACIPGSVLIDQSLAQEILQTWPKDSSLVTVCHHGIRSLDAAAYLRGHGFTNVRSMSGGIDAWSSQIDSSIPRY